MATYLSGFVSNKAVKAVVYGLILCAMVLGLSLAPGVAEVAQAACVQRTAYTDYYLGKPALIIYTGSNVPPNKDKTAIFYYVNKKGWVGVAAPSNNGVRTDAPQRNSGGWHTYFIATRWYSVFPNIFWNDDWRWRVIEC